MANLTIEVQDNEQSSVSRTQPEKVKCEEQESKQTKPKQVKVDGKVSPR